MFGKSYALGIYSKASKGIWIVYVFTLCRASIKIRIQMSVPLTCGDRVISFKLVNTMAADALAPYVARTSAAIILTV